VSDAGHVWNDTSRDFGIDGHIEFVAADIGRIDASGRVADRATVTALGWRGGDRLTLTADAGVMIAGRDPGGMVTVPARPCIVIPAALRRRCGLRAGDHVLLAALPREDMLAAYSFAVVDEAMRAHVRFPRGDGGGRDCHDPCRAADRAAPGCRGGVPGAVGADGPDSGGPG
jgi:hypothetical protein